MRRLAVLLVLPAIWLPAIGLPAIACVEAPIEVKTDFPELPALPENGMRLPMPELVIESGQDITWCYVPEFVPETDMVVKSALAFQGKSGHHMAVYRSGVPRPAGEVFDCTALETMVSMLPLVIPDKPDVDTHIMPAGFGVRVPAGSSIVVQSHTINTDIEPIRIADVLQLEVAAPEETLTEASYWVISHNEIVLDTGPQTITKTCTISEETSLVFQLGHMHEWGKSMSVTRDHGGAVDTIYDVERWTAEFRDNGPTNSYPSDAPLVLAPGDVITLTCNYDNDTGGEIRWPTEMCVTLGAYFPARGGGFLDCDEAVGD